MYWGTRTQKERDRTNAIGQIAEIVELDRSDQSVCLKYGKVSAWFPGCALSPVEEKDEEMPEPVFEDEIVQLQKEVAKLSADRVAAKSKKKRKLLTKQIMDLEQRLMELEGDDDDDDDEDDEDEENMDDGDDEDDDEVLEDMRMTLKELQNEFENTEDDEAKAELEQQIKHVESQIEQFLEYRALEMEMERLEREHESLQGKQHKKRRKELEKKMEIVELRMSELESMNIDEDDDEDSDDDDDDDGAEVNE